jgi:hypothetical protein
MINSGRKKVDGQVLKRLRAERREAKNRFIHAKVDEKESTKDEYIQKQKQDREQIKIEQTTNIPQKLEKKMASENGHQTFCKERRKLVRDDESTWLVTKDEHGQQIFDPKNN